MPRTVRSLLQDAPVLDPQTTGSEVYDLFSEDADLLVCPVVEDNRPIGLIARNAFFLRMADTHGRALFARRPVTFVMKKDPLIVEGDQLLSALSKLILTDRTCALFDGFIITREGRYAGVGTGVGLMRVMQKESEERNRKSAALAEQLSRTRQDAVSANQAKTDFLAIASHEMRTPLSGVLGVSQLLMETPLTPDQRRLTETIQNSGETLLQLLNDVLDLSRLDAGKMELKRVDFAVSDLARSAEDLWRPQALAKGLDFTVTLQSDAIEALHGDPVRLKSVISNLIGNAIKFTPAGRVSVDMTVSTLTLNRKILRVDVRDTGCGVPEMAKRQLFKAFTQADPATPPEQGGSGLGLPLCKRLVDLMGGSLDFTSAEGTGSHFWFEIPMSLAQTQLTEPPAPPAAVITRPVSPRPPRILLAEDNKVSQEVISGFLKLRGWSCDLVTEGHAVIEALNACAYDLVLMDVQMTGLDGVQTTQRIRSLEGAASQTPILALSENIMWEDRARCLKAGMNGYASKPIKRDAFFGEMDRLLMEDTASAAAPSPVLVANAVQAR